MAVAMTLASIRADAALPEVDLSGFGTAGFAITNTGKAEFGRSAEQYTGASNQGDVGVDPLAHAHVLSHCPVDPFCQC